MNELGEHEMRCNNCGQIIDLRDLSQVFAHEECNGIPIDYKNIKQIPYSETQKVFCYGCNLDGADSQIEIIDICQSCHGYGQGVIPEQKCHNCKGSGNSWQMVLLHKKCLDEALDNLIKE